MKKIIIETNYQKVTLQRNNIIRKLLAYQLQLSSNIFVFELELKEDVISYHILNIHRNNIIEYRTTKKFFQEIYQAELIELIGSYGNKTDNITRGIFTEKNTKHIISFMLNEIINIVKPSKKQINILSKAYKQIIYKNMRNSQFYIIPSIKERTIVKRYERIHKNTINSLMKKGLISKKIGQVYQITKQAKYMLKQKAIKELYQNNIFDIPVEEWIKTPKLMQEYISRIQGGTK